MIWNTACAWPEVARGEVALMVPYSLHPVAGTLPEPGPHVICFDTSLPFVPFCSIHALYEIPVRIWFELFASVNVNSFAAPFILRLGVPVNRASVIESVDCCDGVGSYSSKHGRSFAAFMVSAFHTPVAWMPASV